MSTREWIRAVSLPRRRRDASAVVYAQGRCAREWHYCASFQIAGEAKTGGIEMPTHSQRWRCSRDMERLQRGGFVAALFRLAESRRACARRDMRRRQPARSSLARASMVLDLGWRIIEAAWGAVARGMRRSSISSANCARTRGRQRGSVAGSAYATALHPASRERIHSHRPTESAGRCM